MIKDIEIKEWFCKNKDRKDCAVTQILGVDYAHLKLEKEDDLYITKYGLPFIENLRPENFLTDKEWFNEHSLKLSGSSCIYKVRTKKIKGKFKDVTIKWNRMGQDIPGEDEIEELMNAEFNSPFEEFSLVEALSNSMESIPNKVIIQKPLAVYTPSKLVDLERMGRKEYKMQLKIEAHKEIALDMCRSYAVIYEWIKGIDAVQAFSKNILDKESMELLTLDTEKKIKKKGFVVRDRKPHHIIVRPKKDVNLTKNRKGEILCALIDFELLERIPEQEEIVKKSKRVDYLKRQRDRFAIEIPKKFHPHLRHINIFGVDYVYGHAESTKGRLWIVGKDPYLFDYFLPERWEQIQKTKISVFSEMYHTVTKDNIHLAWKVSRVGLRPDMDPFKEDEKKILEYGYNSPFEEIAIAVELTRRGIATIYPRAIYMAAKKADISSNLRDSSRYENHQGIFTPDNMPILKKNRDYIIIWGYWNGSDEKLAAKDGDYYEGIDALRAYREGVITQEKYISLLQVAKEKLLQAGIEDFNLRGNHFLISFDNTGTLIKDSQGMPEIRLCNFEFLKKI